jgi:hypothetical protein
MFHFTSLFLLVSFGELVNYVHWSTSKYPLVQTCNCRSLSLQPLMLVTVNVTYNLKTCIETVVIPNFTLAHQLSPIVHKVNINTYFQKQKCHHKTFQFDQNGVVSITRTHNDCLQSRKAQEWHAQDKQVCFLKACHQDVLSLDTGLKAYKQSVGLYRLPSEGERRQLKTKCLQICSTLVLHQKKKCHVQKD